MGQVTEFDCQSCGACCSFKWSWPVLKRDRSDAVNIPKEMQREDFPLLKTCKDRCVALNGEVFNNVSCKIYENRPSACRSFEAGSQLCLEARAKFNKK